MHEFKLKVESILPIVEMIWTLKKDRGVADRDFLTKEVSEIPAFFDTVKTLWDETVEKLVADCDFVQLVKLEEKLIALTQKFLQYQSLFEPMGMLNFYEDSMPLIGPKQIQMLPLSQ